MSKGLSRGLTVLALALGLYAMLGFLIIPGMALRLINQQLALYSLQPAELKRLEFNPFTLQLDIWQARIGPADAAQVAFEQLSAQLNWRSLWQGVLEVEQITLSSPHIELALDSQGQLNLTQLFKLPPASPEAPAESTGELFPVHIKQAAIHSASLHFSDARTSPAIDYLVPALELSAQNISTLKDANGQLTLHLAAADGGRLSLLSQLSLNPVSAQGTVGLGQVPLTSFWPYAAQATELQLASGTLQLSSQFKFSLEGGLNTELEHLSASLAQLALKAPDQQPLLQLEDLTLSGSQFDLGKRQVLLGQLSSAGLEAWAVRQSNGQINWLNWIGPKPAQSATSPAPAPAHSDAAAPAKSQPQPQDQAQPQSAQANEASQTAEPWQLVLNQVQLANWRLHLTDNAVKPATVVDIQPLKLHLAGYDSSANQPIKIELDAGLNKHGKLVLQGALKLKPLSGQFSLTSSNLDLRLAQGYLAPFVRIELRSGMASSKLAIDLRSVDPLNFGLTGQLGVRQLHTLDSLKSRDLLKWRKLDVLGFDYQHGQKLSIERIKLNQPYARFILNEDRSTNLKELLVEQPKSPAPAKTAPSKPLAIHIGGIDLAEGSANFADFSLKPSFATAIAQLSGQIGTLDSSRPQPTPVDIKGKVDRYAPVSIKGQLNPFDPLTQLDIATSFKRVELTTLTPYSGKFAGYRINKGRLNLDVHYQINKGQLQAQNRMVLEDLQLGEQVDSKDAVDLPVRLAVALLKDSEGNIDIDLPLSGDLNNPDFKVGPIVWQTLRNLVVRAVQAPFKLLGGLVGANEQAPDLDRVSFAPASDSVNSEAAQALKQLVEALNQRPALRLEVQGIAAAASDGPQLAQQRLDQEYQSTYYKMLQRQGDKVPSSPAELKVPEGIKSSLLEGIYRARLKKQPPAEWKQLSSDDHQAQLEAAVLANWQNNETLLRRLAQRRGLAIKDYLVSQGLSDERVFLLDVTLNESGETGPVASRLQLDSR